MAFRSWFFTSHLIGDCLRCVPQRHGRFAATSSQTVVTAENPEFGFQSAKTDTCENQQRASNKIRPLESFGHVFCSSHMQWTRMSQPTATPPSCPPMLGPPRPVPAIERLWYVDANQSDACSHVPDRCKNSSGR